MEIELDLDIADNLQHVPTEEQFRGWITQALTAGGYNKNSVELSVMVVSETVSQTLNDQYRGKNKPTNVLSFPAEIPEFVESELIGDMVICAPLVQKEAEQQNKSLQDHWAHLTIHGCLHLLGFDHIEDEEAEQMEAIEIKVLQQLGIANPYLLIES
jgi:probable rRNA maturation factor